MSVPEGCSVISPSRSLVTSLEVEMDEHLCHPKHPVERRNHGISRNGTTSKTLITDVGPVEIDVPHDREGSFEPATVRKNPTSTRHPRTVGGAGVEGVRCS